MPYYNYITLNYIYITLQWIIILLIRSIIFVFFNKFKIAKIGSVPGSLELDDIFNTYFYLNNNN